VDRRVEVRHDPRPGPRVLVHQPGQRERRLLAETVSFQHRERFAPLDPPEDITHVRRRRDGRGVQQRRQRLRRGHRTEAVAGIGATRGHRVGRPDGLRPTFIGAVRLQSVADRVERAPPEQRQRRFRRTGLDDERVRATELGLGHDVGLRGHDDRGTGPSAHRRPQNPGRLATAGTTDHQQ
jgi:hypothetical protein